MVKAPAAHKIGNIDMTIFIDIASLTNPYAFRIYTTPPFVKLSRILKQANTIADASSSYPIISDTNEVEVFIILAIPRP